MSGKQIFHVGFYKTGTSSTQRHMASLSPSQARGAHNQAAFSLGNNHGFSIRTQLHLVLLHLRNRQIQLFTY